VEVVVTLPRRQFLQLPLGAAAWLTAQQPAYSQAYPTKPVRILVGVPPGGTFDIVARLISQWLSQRLGQQFVVVNRPGANTTLATNMVAHADPDGYTLILMGPPATINVTLYNNLGFDFQRDIVPVAGVESMPLLMVVHPSLPAKTIPEFIDYAKSKPGQINVGCGGVGATGHVSGALFSMLTGIKVTFVPYRGEAPALTDLLGGRVQAVFATAASAMNYVRQGQLRALAISSDTKFNGLPDVPPFTKFLPGYQTSSWVGIGTPRNTPTAIIETLNREINAAIADPAIKARLADFAAEVMPGSVERFQTFVSGEVAKWAKVIKSANIKPI
jgi:tripartite-type tricarboxylate transporter receptor subunit TctC